MKLKNSYFILRHGQTIHQTKKRGIIYGWPDDSPPCSLTDYGKQQVKKTAKILKNKNIDLIYSSDALRTKQTAQASAQVLGLKVIYDKRLREVNWGVYQCQPLAKANRYYSDIKERFIKAPPKGESWSELRGRMAAFIKEIDKKYENKTILIVSHGDPLWLLQGWVRNLSDVELLEQKKSRSTIKTSELRKL